VVCVQVLCHVLDAAAAKLDRHDVIDWRGRRLRGARRRDHVGGCLGNLSWFVLQGKGVVDNGTLYRRQLCFQFNSAGAVRIKYSARGGFVTGSPSLTQVPAAADEALFYGGGTDASPTFTAIFPSSGSWMQGVFSESTDAFFALTYPVGGGQPTSLIYLDVLPLVYTIGGSLLDPDPCVMYAAAGE